MKQLKFVSFSGGLDSSTVLGIELEKAGDWQVQPIAFDYGQRHRVELYHAEKVWQFYKRKFGEKLMPLKTLIKTDLFVKETSSLLDKSPSYPRLNWDGSPESTFPNTFVPGRNLQFLLEIAKYSQLVNPIGVLSISLGVNVVDYSGYPDCRPEFIKSAEETLSLAFARPVTIHTPLIELDKITILKKARRLGVADLTWSCYNPIKDMTTESGFRPCGECDSCIIRKKAELEVSSKEPLEGENNGK